MNPLPHESEYQEKPKRFLGRLREQFFGSDEEDGSEGYDARTPQAPPSAAAKPQRGLSVHVSRASRVAVRLNLQVVDDAKVAIDGLRNGEHQIINLEKAKSEMRERILDSLSGACYALDGKMHRIGDKVFMFVPANVDVDAGETEAAAFRRSPYDDDASF